MDINRYYRKVRELESVIPEKEVYVVSLATSDGGKEGVMTQVMRRPACLLIIEGKARLAEASEVDAYEKEQAEKRAAIEKEELARKVTLHLVTDTAGKLVGTISPKKG